MLTVGRRYATSGVEETMELLHRGNQNRAVEPTKRNETSSRSHAVLQIVIDKEMKTAAIQKTILIGLCSYVVLFASVTRFFRQTISHRFGGKRTREQYRKSGTAPARGRKY